MLKIKNLCVSFRSVSAVRGVDIELKEGETLAIVGESGCGKSATAKSIVQLLPPTASVSGEIWYKEQQLLSLSPKEMRRIRGKEIGMIFQDPMTSLNPTLKIGTQIAEGIPEGWNKALEMLESVGIPDPAKRAAEYPHTLSGGMRQRAMIALALAKNPRLLIADEPTTALDVTIQAQILALMKDLQVKMGMSILLITHDLSLVAGFCDRVLVMYAGKIVEDAPVEELFRSPRHPYTQRLLLSKPRLDMPQDTPLLAIEGSPPKLSEKIMGCPFAPRCYLAQPSCFDKEPPVIHHSPSHRSACLQHD